MIKRFGKSLAWRMGLEVRRRVAAVSPFARQRELLQAFGVGRPTIFDVGAHYGETYRDCRKLFPGARIFSFEPFPDSFEILKSKMAGDAEAKAIQAAVSDRPGVAVFHVNKFDATNSLLPRTEGERRYYSSEAGPKDKIEVPTTTLDEFVAREGIDAIHILKLDVQGAELLALKGAQETLRRKPPPIIFTETMIVAHYAGQPLLPDLWGFLAPFGYSLFDLSGFVRASNGQLRYGDALFVSADLRRGVIDSAAEEP